MSDDLRTLWAAQARDATAPDPAELAARAERLRRRIWRRDAIEYAASVPVVGAFLWIGAQSPDWGVRGGCIAIVLGTLLVMRNLWVRRTPAAPAALAVASFAHYRALLVRQRDMLASVRRWYLAPLAPGLLLLLLATFRQAATHLPLPVALASLALGLIPAIIAFAGVDWLNRIAARRLDREIAALDALVPPSFTQQDAP